MKTNTKQKEPIVDNLWKMIVCFFYSIGVSKRRFCVFKRIKLIKLFILDGIAYDDTDSDRSGDDNESLPREKKAKKGKITDLIQGRK